MTIHDLNASSTSFFHVMYVIELSRLGHSFCTEIIQLVFLQFGNIKASLSSETNIFAITQTTRVKSCIGEISNIGQLELFIEVLLYNFCQISKESVASFYFIISYDKRH